MTSLTRFHRRVAALSDAELRHHVQQYVAEPTGALRALIMDDLHLRLVAIGASRDRLGLTVDWRALDAARDRLTCERQLREPWRCLPGTAPEAPPM